MLLISYANETILQGFETLVNHSAKIATLF